MRIRGWIALVVSLLTLFALGCRSTGAPIANVASAPIPMAAGKTLSMDEVHKAILRAGPASGWTLQSEGPGRILGRVAFGTGERHVAMVGIQHDAKQYSITYRDSTNLNADGMMIHRAYNEWVGRLDKAIRAQFQ